MSSFFDNIIKEDDIRLEYKGLVIKQVTRERKENIKKFMVTNFIVDESGREVIESTFSGVGLYRYLMTELTNWGKDIENISDEQLEKYLLNGNEVIEKMLNEFNKICEEIAEEQKNATLEVIDRLVSVGDTIDYNNKVNESLDSVSGKLGISREEVLQLIGNQNQLAELQKLLDAENKKKQLPKPQDYLPSQEKKKRGRKSKKTEQTVVEVDGSIQLDELKLQELKDKLSENKLDVIESGI